MKRKTSLNLNAQKARILLVGVLLLMVAAGGGGFYYAHQWLQATAENTNKTVAQAEASESNIENLRMLESTLAEYATEREDARNISVENKKYEYQDQILILDKYAKSTGVHITSIDYSEGLDGASGSSAPPPAPTPTSPGDALGGSAPTPLQTKTVSITLDAPVDYHNLLLFIRKIEQSPVRMQIASVSVAADAASNGRRVNPESFTIDIYVR